MRRVRDLLSKERLSASPFERPDYPALRRVGRQLTAADVGDILDELDRVSREREALPAWDGDSSDEIAAWQADLSAMLGAARGPARAVLERDRAPRESGTKAYVELALAMRPWWSRWWRATTFGANRGS